MSGGAAEGTPKEISQEAARDLYAAAQLAERCFKEALPKFDWGKSALDVNAIQLLNTAPSAVSRALARARGDA